jgi:hypothetical protein
MTLPEPDLDGIFDLVPGQGSVPKDIERVGLRMLEYFRRAAPVFVALVAHPSFDVQEFLKHHHVPASQLGERLAAHLAAEAGRGRVRKGDHAAAAGLLISHVHNIALLAGLGAIAGAEATRSIAEAVGVMWDGLAP